jgi:hypothetical protein
MRRIVVLLTVSALMLTTLVLTATPASALIFAGPRGSTGPAWGVPVEPAMVCNTVAGVAGFEWQAGGEVCWLNLPVKLPASSR